MGEKVKWYDEAQQNVLARTQGTPESKEMVRGRCVKIKKAGSSKSSDGGAVRR